MKRNEMKRAGTVVKSVLGGLLLALSAPGWLRKLFLKRSDFRFQWLLVGLN